MNDCVLAFYTWATPENVVRALAVAGGALIGGLLFGQLAKFMAWMLAGAKLPPFLLNFMRLVGAIGVAYLVALFVFGSGTGQGLGFGAPGTGGGPGKGGEGGDSVGVHPPDLPATKESKKDDGGVVGNRLGNLRLEVLGFAGNATIADGRFYRFEGDDKRLTLDELKALTDQRRRETPELRKIEIVLYENSPDRDTAPVRDLQRWATLSELTPVIVLAAGKAP